MESGSSLDGRMWSKNMHQQINNKSMSVQKMLVVSLKSMVIRQLAIVLDLIG